MKTLFIFIMLAVLTTSTSAQTAVNLDSGVLVSYEAAAEIDGYVYYSIVLHEYNIQYSRSFRAETFNAVMNGANKFISSSDNSLVVKPIKLYEGTQNSQFKWSGYLAYGYSTIKTE